MKQTARPLFLVILLFWLSSLFAAGVAQAAPTLTSPVAGTAFTSSTQAFTWDSGGSTVTHWMLYVGSAKGKYDYFRSARLAGSVTSVTASNLPVNAHKAYVRLRYKSNGVWRAQNSIFYLSGQNHSPVFTNALGSEAVVDKVFTFIPKVTETDGEKVTYAISGKPKWATFNKRTGKLTGTPTTAYIGTSNSVVITAKDERGATATTAATLVVLPPSEAALVEEALSTGSIANVSSEALLNAALAELAAKKPGQSLVTALYGTDAIDYTPEQHSQLTVVSPWVDTAFPILMGTKGNTLAMAGTTTSARYAAFGTPPTNLFKAGQSLSFEAPFGRLLAWLLAGEPINISALDNAQTIALSMVSSTSRSNFKAWIAQHYPALTVVDCNAVATLVSCYSTASLVVADGISSNTADAPTINQAVGDVLAAGKPVLYLHTRGWSSIATDKAVASLMNVTLPYGGNYWSVETATWADVSLMQTAEWDKQGLASIERVLQHFKANDYTLAVRDTEFYPGANLVRNTMQQLDVMKVDLFAKGQSRFYRLLALLGDSYRQAVRFPMDANSTDPNIFLKSLFADYAVYNYRAINPVPQDLGNFSRTDFSHITPITKTVNMVSRQSFRAAGVYALPGQTFRVTRNDSSSTATKVFVNTMNSGSTHEYEALGYKRPKFLRSAAIPLQIGETIAITSPYGGPIQIEFSTNDQPVQLTFQQVGEHPFWDDTADNADFTVKLAKGDYDWAEFVTPAFEIHSTLEKMRTSASDARWGGTLEGFAAATMRYIHNFPHVLAGFKGSYIDVVPEIHDFATANGYTIENLDKVKHMNADQASCGYGCSGNPYDAYWAFDPIGHGDIHEMGHGLESSRFRLAGWSYHASTNPYSYFSKTQFVKDRLLAGDALAAINPDCQPLPFQEAFTALQASVEQTDPVAYMNANYWGASPSWSKGVSMTIQMMMTAEHQGVLQDGWHLLARLHILEREFNRAKANTTTWDAKKASLGFSSYTKTEAGAITSNDWMVIAVSKATGLDYRDYFAMWGQAVTTKAAAEVAGFNYSSAPRNFFITSPSGYCKGEGFDGNHLPVNGQHLWPLAQ